jgi:hypothetical protein
MASGSSRNPIPLEIIGATGRRTTSANTAFAIGLGMPKKQANLPKI